MDVLTGLPTASLSETARVSTWEKGSRGKRKERDSSLISRGTDTGTGSFSYCARRKGKKKRKEEEGGECGRKEKVLVEVEKKRGGLNIHNELDRCRI